MDKDEIAEKIPITTEGLNELKTEYQTLTNDKRPAVIERIAKSRNVGDMVEDNEYTQAKQELTFIEGRISELDDVINRATIVIKPTVPKSAVDLGSKVTVMFNRNQFIFHLVGEWEANPANQRISHKSPLGQALIGKKVGDEVEIEAPVGKIVYKIVKID